MGRRILVLHCLKQDALPVCTQSKRPIEEAVVENNFALAQYPSALLRAFSSSERYITYIERRNESESKQRRSREEEPLVARFKMAYYIRLTTHQGRVRDGFSRQSLPTGDAGIFPNVQKVRPEMGNAHQTTKHVGGEHPS